MILLHSESECRNSEAEIEGRYSTISLYLALLCILEDVLRNSTLIYTSFLNAGTSRILDWITVAYLCTVLAVNLDCICLLDVNNKSQSSKVTLRSSRLH